MRVLINISVVSLKLRGMGFFTKKIVLNLIEADGHEYIFVSGNIIDSDLHDKITRSKHHFILVKSPLPIFEQLVIPYLIIKYKPDVSWFPSNTFPLFKFSNNKFIVTIHDLIFFKDYRFSTKFKQYIGKTYRKVNVYCGISKIDIITSVSRTTSSELLNFFKGTVSKRPVVLYNSFEPVTIKNSDILKKLSVNNKKYIYTISGDAPHKNIDFLISSFLYFLTPDNDHFLVVSGAPNLKSRYSNSNIIFTGIISENEKAVLISNATLFVFASISEGFGIPLIEGLYYNESVLASDIPIFREIGKDFISYFDLGDIYFLNKYFESPKLIIDHDAVKTYIKDEFNCIRTTKTLEELF